MLFLRLGLGKNDGDHSDDSTFLHPPSPSITVIEKKDHIIKNTKIMETLTNEQMKALTKEQVEAGAIEIPEEELSNVGGGIQATIYGVTDNNSNIKRGEWRDSQQTEKPEKPHRDYL